MAKKIEIGPLIGYARVCLRSQDLAQRRGTLRETGCTRIFEEMVSGVKRDRRELGRLLEHLRAGDVMTVTRLDAVGRVAEVVRLLGVHRATLYRARER